jgi:hypothetical protein
VKQIERQEYIQWLKMMTPQELQAVVSGYAELPATSPAQKRMRKEVVELAKNELRWRR